jgi:hypothetical protein
VTALAPKVGGLEEDMKTVHPATDDKSMRRVTADVILLYPRDVRTRSTPLRMTNW